MAHRAFDFKNKYGCIVPGTVSQNPLVNLESGLYIPGMDFVIDGYINAYLQKSGLGGLNHYRDEKVIEKVREKVKKKGVRTAVPKFVREKFLVLDRKYTSSKLADSFRLEGFNEAIWRAINRDNC